MLISNNTILLKCLENKKAEFWSDVADVPLRDVADVSLLPLPDLQKRKRHLSDGATRIRAEYNCGMWYKDGIEHDGSLAT